VQLELGGKNPVLVLSDADIDAAAEVVARSSFGGLSRAGVHRCRPSARARIEVHDELLERVVAKAGALVLGPGDRDGVTMGPLIADSRT
jgi:alpha-ketoglutaric semialdehyde dehydrogenase